MIDLAPVELHETYRVVVPSTFDALLSAYPACPLKLVKVYRGPPHDRSLGNADEPGVVALNAYWFTDRPLEALREEAREGYLFTLPGDETVIKWHGGAAEPQHLFAHEFAHVLADVIIGSEEWSRLKWREATADPSNCAPSGYALAGPHEFWAECFALMWLNVQGLSGRVVMTIEEMRGMLGR